MKGKLKFSSVEGYAGAGADNSGPGSAAPGELRIFSRAKVNLQPRTVEVRGSADVALYTAFAKGRTVASRSTKSSQRAGVEKKEV